MLLALLPARPVHAQENSPVDLTGAWRWINHEDERDRNPGAFPGDYRGLPLNDAARMHNRGKAECLEAIYPTGRVETLSCASFRFNWHLNYVYADETAPLLPAGTVLHSIM